MLLISLNQQSDKSRGADAAAPREKRRKKPLLAVAILLLAVPAFPAQVFAQHGLINGVFGAMINQGMQPSPQYYQPPPPPPWQYEQSVGRLPTQQATPSLQSEEAQQMRQENAVAVHTRKHKPQPAVAAARAATNGVITVKMKKTGGTFEVPVRINNAVAINFTVDSGAADVMIPANVVSALIKSGTLKQEDYIGGQTFTLADGSTLPSVRFKLASLQVGDRTFTDVVASVAPAAGSALLGQSFLSRFESWTLDNTRGTLNLTMPSANLQRVAAASATNGAKDPPPAAEPLATAVATPAAQPADAAKPAPGDVAPDKVAAVSAAPAPSAEARAHSGFVLPAFPDQTSYAAARTHLIALGYDPQDVSPCDPNNKSCFPERVSCFGTDVIECNFKWKHGDTAILVQTVNYPPTVAKVECEKNCR
jgi:clan AA aspartic protease (TIGR02281 family)